MPEPCYLDTIFVPWDLSGRHKLNDIAGSQPFSHVRCWTAIEMQAVISMSSALLLLFVFLQPTYGDSIV